MPTIVEKIRREHVISADDPTLPYQGDVDYLICQKDAAVYIGCSMPTFYKLIREFSVPLRAFYRGHKGILRMYNKSELDSVIDSYDPTGHKTVLKYGSRNNILLRKLLGEFKEPLRKLRESASMMLPWDEICYGETAISTEYDDFEGLFLAYGITDVEAALSSA